MANWEKLNKEFDDALDSMTKEDWDNWYKNVEQKRINQNNMTAVEWLIEQLESKPYHSNYREIIEQAKEMEKEQMIEFALFRDDYLEKAEKLEDFTIPNEKLIELFKHELNKSE